MSNFELISAYNEEDAAWLREQGYPHPAVRPGNEMPSTADMKWALEEDEELSFDYPRGEEELYGTNAERHGFRISGFDWDDNPSCPGEYFTVRSSDVILAALIRLCARCGQLLLYPDSGAPSIILDAALDAEAVSELYAEAVEREDGWEYFFERMYGPDGLASG
jgi:hypothetical protein